MVNLTYSFKAAPEDAARLNEMIGSVNEILKKEIDGAQRRNDQERLQALLTLQRRVTPNNMIRSGLAYAVRHAKASDLLKLIEEEGVKTGRPARGS